MKMQLFLACLFTACLFTTGKIAAQISGPPQTQSLHIEADGVRSNRYGNFDLDGSPFLTDGWISGTATSDKGQNYSLILKYDVIKDQPVFADRDSGIMMFVVPIIRFTLNNDVYQNGYPAADEWTKATYYKTLGNGKSKLLKHFYKKKMETRDIGGLTGYKYEDNTACYLF